MFTLNQTSVDSAGEDAEFPFMAAQLGAGPNERDRNELQEDFLSSAYKLNPPIFVALLRRSVHPVGLRTATALRAVLIESQRFLQMFHSICEVNGWFLLHRWETFNAKLTGTWLCINGNQQTGMKHRP